MPGKYADRLPVPTGSEDEGGSPRSSRGGHKRISFSDDTRFEAAGNPNHYDTGSDDEGRAPAPSKKNKKGKKAAAPVPPPPPVAKDDDAQSVAESEAVQSHLSHDADSVGQQSSLDESFNGSTATSGKASRVSSTGGTSTGVTICGRYIKIPFTVWTLLAMSMPVMMLLITALIPMVVSTQDLVLVASFNGLSKSVSDCVTAMTQEDRTMYDHIYLPTATSRALYTSARVDVDRFCDTMLLTELRRMAQVDPVFDTQRDQLQRTVRELVVERALMDSEMDAWNTTAQKERIEILRPAMEAVIFRATNVIARVAAVVKSETSRYFVDLNLVGITRAKLWMAASTGSAYLSTPNATKDEFIAFTGAVATAESAAKSVEGAASPAVASLVATWMRVDTTEAMFFALRGVLLVGASIGHDREAFARIMTQPLAELRYIETEIVAFIAAAEASRNSVIQNSILLGVGVILSAIATGLLARQQLKIQGILQVQMDRVEKTKRAVAAFVPRFFLNKMGYTSITHVSVGDSAEVALTMIFAVIQDFTTVAEGLSNRVLFDWVQGYFKLMTNIIEGHHGNINQFIGDALFALFSTANDGVLCSIEMQAKTQQLNLQRLCVEGNTVPLDIGIGLHHDVLSLGILGDEKRHTCTAISASVNLASRLEGLTKQLGCRVLASEAVIDQLGPSVRDSTRMRRVGKAQVKGSGTDVPIYDVYQADVRAVQAYKSATQKAFEKYTRLALRPDLDISESDEAKIDRLLREMRAVAAEHGVKDQSLDTMERARNPQTGSLVFDHK